MRSPISPSATARGCMWTARSDCSPARLPRPRTSRRGASGRTPASPMVTKDAKPDELDALNQRLGAELLTDGRVYAGTTRYRGVVAFRPAIVNWRTTQADIDLLVDVVRELGARLRVAAAV